MDRIVNFDKLALNDWKTPVVATLGALGGVVMVAGMIFAISYSGHGIRALHGTLAGRASLASAFSVGGALLISTGVIGIKVKEIKIGRSPESSYFEAVPKADRQVSLEALHQVRIHVTSDEFLSGSAQYRFEKCIWCEEELQKVDDSDKKQQMVDFVAYLKKQAQEDLEEIQRFLADKEARKTVEYRQVKPSMGSEFQQASDNAERIKQGKSNSVELLCTYVRKFKGRISENLVKLIVENDLDYHIAVERSNEESVIDSVKRQNVNYVIYTVEAEVPKRDDQGNIILKQNGHKPTLDHKGMVIPQVMNIQSSYTPVMVPADAYSRRVYIDGVEQAGKNPLPGSRILVRISSEKLLEILPPNYQHMQQPDIVQGD